MWYIPTGDYITIPCNSIDTPQKHTPVEQKRSDIKDWVLFAIFSVKFDKPAKVFCGIRFQESNNSWEEQSLERGTNCSPEAANYSTH